MAGDDTSGRGRDRTCGWYWAAHFFDRRFSQIGNADRAQIFFIVGSRFFYADGDLGLLRGGRNSADCRHEDYRLNTTSRLELTRITDCYGNLGTEIRVDQAAALAGRGHDLRPPHASGPI